MASEPLEVMSRLSVTIGRSRQGLHSEWEGYRKSVQCKLRRNADVPSVCGLEAVSRRSYLGRRKRESPNGVAFLHGQVGSRERGMSNVIVLLCLWVRRSLSS